MYYIKIIAVTIFVLGQMLHAADAQQDIDAKAIQERTARVRKALLSDAPTDHGRYGHDQWGFMDSSEIILACRLIKEGIDVNAQMKNDASFLSQACARTCPAVAKALINAKADITTIDHSWVDKDTHYTIYKLMLEEHPNLDMSVGGQGKTPLHRAYLNIHGGSVAVFQYLLLLGADPTITTFQKGTFYDNQQTAIHALLRMSKREIACQLSMYDKKEVARILQYRRQKQGGLLCEDVFVLRALNCPESLQSLTAQLPHLTTTIQEYCDDSGSRPILNNLRDSLPVCDREEGDVQRNIIEYGRYFMFR